MVRFKGGGDLTEEMKRYGFHPTMVRFKARPDPGLVAGKPPFPSHYGAI